MAIRVPRGTKMTCKGWQQEGILRMLLNTLDEEVAEHPEDLIIYGTAKAVRDNRALANTIKALRELDGDETLVMQSGKPVAVFKTHELAPRVVMSNAMLVPAWATWDEFRRLERKGLTMYAQSTAGSWAYIGSQGILEGTIKTFAQVAERHFGGSLRGRLVLTSGLGGMGCAQPQAITANGGVALVVEVDPDVLVKRLKKGYCDVCSGRLSEALALAEEALKRSEPRSIGLLGNASEVYPELVARGVVPDVVTDQTSAHDLLKGYVPGGMSYEEAVRLRRRNPERYVARTRDSIRRHFRAMLDFKRSGSVVFDYGNNIRGEAYELGIKEAFEVAGFVEAYLRPLFYEGRGPFRWVALSGCPEDIFLLDELVKSEFPEDRPTIRWIEYAQKSVWFDGLPARVCWLDPSQRARFGRLCNQMVREHKLRAPIAITRCHMDGGAMASPNRESERMLDHSDAIADWPVLNALLLASCGATMVSLNHGGGVGIGLSIHSGFTVIADGREEMHDVIGNLLRSDPSVGVVRYADAGYPGATAACSRLGIRKVEIAGRRGQAASD